MWQHFHIGDMRKVTEGHLRLDIWVTTGKAHKKVRSKIVETTSGTKTLWFQNAALILFMFKMEK